MSVVRKFRELSPRRRLVATVGLALGVPLGVVAVLVLLLAVQIRRDGLFPGTPLGPEAVAAAQATVDACSPDYPIEVTDVREHEFMADRWQEWHLRARQDPDHTQTITVHGPVERGTCPGMKLARERFKIARDGEVGRDPYTFTAPAGPRGVATATVSGDDPIVSFADHSPLDQRTPVALHVEVAGRRLEAAEDAALVRRLLDWARGEGRPVKGIEMWHTAPESQYTFDTFRLTPEAAAAVDLEARLTRAREGGQAPGVAYQELGTLETDGVFATRSRGGFTAQG